MSRRASVGACGLLEGGPSAWAHRPNAGLLETVAKECLLDGGALKGFSHRPASQKRRDRAAVTPRLPLPMPPPTHLAALPGSGGRGPSPVPGWPGLGQERLSSEVGSSRTLPTAQRASKTAASETSRASQQVSLMTGEAGRSLDRREVRVMNSLQRLIGSSRYTSGGSEGSPRFKSNSLVNSLFGPEGPNLSDSYSANAVRSDMLNLGRMVFTTDLDLEQECVQRRIMENRKLEHRVEASDKRREVALEEQQKHQHKRKSSKPTVLDEMSKLLKEMSPSVKSAVAVKLVNEEDSNFADDHNDIKEIARYELDYEVCRWSSQHGEHRAENLRIAGGRYETSAGKTKHQSVTFELLAGPGTVIGIDFGILDVLAAPRRCKLQYSAAGLNGPWQEAWKFSVNSPGSMLPYRSMFEYGTNVRIFSRSILRYVGGDEDAAFRLLDTEGTGRVSYDHLLSLCRKLQMLRGNPAAAAIASADLRSLFRELDTEGQSSLGIKELLHCDVKNPKTQWWRLHVFDNWSSPNNIVIGGTLKLLSPDPQRRLPLQVSSLMAPGRPEKDFLAFEVAKGPTEVDSNLRHLAFEHDLKYSEVQEIQDKFKTIDTDGSGTITRDEFELLVIKVYNLTDASDLAATRIDFFWKQVDKDGNGSVDFSEFVSWHKAVKNAKIRPGQMVDMLGAAILRGGFQIAAPRGRGGLRQSETSRMVIALDQVIGDSTFG